MNVFTLLKNFARDEDGLEMVEWAVVAAVVTSVSIGTLTLLGATLNVNFLTVLFRVQAG